MAIKDISSETFESEIKEGVVVVDFWAPWCGPCKMIAPILEELDKEFEGKAKITKLNVDDYQDVANKFGIMSIPTLLVFKNGELQDKTTGFQPKEVFQELIEKHL